MPDNGREGSSGGRDERELLLPPSSPAAAEQQKRKGKSIRQVKHLFHRPFRKSDKGNRKEVPSPPRPPPPPPPIDLYDEELGSKGFYLCFMPPRALPESSMRPSTRRSGGEKPPPYYEYLKSMLERNDYYSEDCNVHRDVGDGARDP